MALETATVALTVKDKLGVTFDPAKTRLSVTTSAEKVIDKSGNENRVGGGVATIGTDGTATVDVWVPGTGSNPSTWQTTFRLDYPDRTKTSGRGVETYGPFTIPANIKVTNKALTSNVATLTTGTAHGLVAGDKVTILGVGAPFDGTFTVATAPTTTTFTFAVTNANVSSTAATGRLAHDLADLVAEMPVQPEYASTLTARVAALEAGGGGGGVAGVSSVNTRTGAVTLAKADVGLANVDNTADSAKPVSTAQQTALDAKATTTALTTHTGNTSNPHAVTKAQVGLGNVDNTSDAAKPVSTATATALAGKASTSHTHVATTDLTATGTKDATTFLRGDNTWAVPAGGGAVSDVTPAVAGAFMVHPAGAVTTTGFFNFSYYSPMALSAPLTIDQVGIEITTAQGAGATVQMGYYTKDSSDVLNRQVVFGTTASDTTGVKIVSGTWTLPAGVIWLAISSSASSGGQFRSGSALALPGPIWVPGSAQIASAANGLRASGSGALPATSIPGTDGSVSMPRFVFRKA